jgi:hypothetical protein
MNEHFIDLHDVLIDVAEISCLEISVWTEIT